MISTGSMSPISRLKVWATGPDGYDWVMKGVRLSGESPEMEFAAALIALDGQKKLSAEHLQKALTGATDGSPLARNLVRRYAVRDESLADLCARYGVAHAASELNPDHPNPMAKK